MSLLGTPVSEHKVLSTLGCDLHGGSPTSRLKGINGYGIIFALKYLLGVRQQLAEIMLLA